MAATVRSTSRARVPGARPAHPDETSQGKAARALTLLAGVVFLAAGIAGFVVTGFEDFAAHDTGDTLLGFEVNGLHNLAHLAFGVLGLVLWRTYRSARAFGLVLVFGYGAVLAFGIAAVGEDWNLLSINTADNWLHLGFVVLGAAIAALAHRAAQQPIDLRDRQLEHTGENRHDRS
jgi:hypothetical protein